MTAPESAFARAVRNLAGGLFDTTPVSWIGAIVFCLLEFAACCVFVVPRRLAKLDQRYLMESPGDEYCSLSIRLMKLRFSKLSRLQVVYVGGSQATRALVTREPRPLSRELSLAAGTKVEFNVMSGNNQRYEHALGITDQLPPSYRGAFVMMVSDYKSDYASLKSLPGARTRIAFTKAPSLLPFYRAIGDYVPPHTGVFFLDHLGFFAARRVAALRFTPVRGNGLSGAGAIKEEKRSEAFAKLYKEREQAEAEGPNAIKRKLRQRAPILTSSRKLMATLIANLKSRHILPIFVEFPHQPIRHEIYQERNDRFQRQFAAFAERKHVTYLDLNPEMDLSAEDFQDQVHLGTLHGRRQFQTALMRHLGDILHERFVDGVDETEGLPDVADADDDDTGDTDLGDDADADPVAP